MTKLVKNQLTYKEMFMLNLYKIPMFFTVLEIWLANMANSLKNNTLGKLVVVSIRTKGCLEVGLLTCMNS